MIIDAHVHIFPPEVLADRTEFFNGEEAFQLIYADPAAKMVSAGELIAALDEDEVDKAVVCGFPWQKTALARKHNDYILAAAQEHPERIIPLAAVDPLDPDGLAEAERALGSGAAGLGEIGAYAADLGQPQVLAGLKSLAGLCHEAGKPLLLHANEPVGHRYPGKRPIGLAGLYQLIQASPQTRFQLGHLSGGLFFYELLKKEVRGVLEKCVFDTAAAPFLYQPQLYPIFAAIAGEERLLYGSDYPLLGLGRYLKEMAQGGVESGFRHKILGENAAAFWGLDSE
ncbi:MAG: amidohydrolase [Deltaproteobacteria bacterium]|nr:amidohydrolase [Deltaproteobacteria bacterium]